MCCLSVCVCAQRWHRRCHPTSTLLFKTKRMPSNGNRMQILVDEKVLQLAQCCEFISSERKINVITCIKLGVNGFHEGMLKVLPPLREVYCHDRTGNIIKSTTAASGVCTFCATNFFCSHVHIVVSIEIPNKNNFKPQVHTLRKTQTSG